MTNFFTHLITVFVIFCIFAVIYGTVVMILWNWLMPMLFGLATINWFQGLGIYCLSHILFSSSTHVDNKD